MKNFLIIVISILFTFPANADNAWNLVKDADGIKIYNRKVDGSDIDEFKAESIINAPVEVLFEVMKDIPSGPQWMANCIESRLVKTIIEFAYSDDGFYGRNLIYNAIAAPFPVSNRDMVVESTVKGSYKLKSITIKYKAVNDNAVPLREGYVRINELAGSWFLQSIDENHTQVIYQVKQNPGGSLPVYVINKVNKDIPFKTISGLKKMVMKEEYIESAKKLKFGYNKDY